MNHNGHRHPIHRPIAQQLADAQELANSQVGGLLLNKILDPIPFDAFVACGMRVLHEGQVAVFVFEPQPMTDLGEAVALFRLLVSMHTPKPGPLDWNTVPETVRRHFRSLDQPNQSPTLTTPQG